MINRQPNRSFPQRPIPHQSHFFRHYCTIHDASVNKNTLRRLGFSDWEPSFVHVYPLSCGYKYNRQA